MRKTIFSLFLSAVLCAPSAAQVSGSYEPSEANVKARSEFQDNKFGIFIHWGIYSLLGDGEWVMNNKNLDWQEYEKLASSFYPVKFNAAEWVSSIKAAGAKYICITSRHHDGFSMFDTKESSFDIVDSTPFGRDIIKELADECRKQGIKLHFYYSHLDWRRADYPVGNTGHGTGREKGKENWDSYYRFMNNQLTELLTNYGEIGAIWFDGVWDKPETFNWQLEEQYDMIHKLQPACLIGNNHHRAPYQGEDFQLFERDLPGENKAGYSAGQEVTDLPLETCETMNHTWGYSITDQNYKTADEIIRYLVKAAGKNANLLLNIGPQPNGELPATALERLQAVGEWMKTYGETIYGTRGGVITPREWGVTTQKGNFLYVHILDCKDKGLFLPLERKVKKATMFKDNTKVRFTQNKDGVFLILEDTPSDVDTVVALELD